MNVHVGLSDDDAIQALVERRAKAFHHGDLVALIACHGYPVLQDRPRTASAWEGA